jgi:hypothetical protein
MVIILMHVRAHGTHVRSMKRARDIREQMLGLMERLQIDVANVLAYPKW